MKKKMIFPRDMFYDDMNVPLYLKDKVYDVEENMVWRWQKRGGQLVEDVVVKVEAPKEPVVGKEEKTEDVPKAPDVKPVVASKKPQQGNKK